MEEILKIENVVKVHGGRQVLSGVNLAVQRDERVLIQGFLGSGKTTLLRLIAGAERPDGGRITAPESVGVVQERDGLIPECTIVENVEMPLRMRGDDAARTQTDAVLERLGIGYIAGAKPESVSPVERRLAALARAAIAQPELLLLDELTAGFDKRNRGRLLAGVDALAQDMQAVVYFATERYGEYVDTAYILNNGQLTVDNRQ